MTAKRSAMRGPIAAVVAALAGALGSALLAGCQREPAVPAAPRPSATTATTPAAGVAPVAGATGPAAAPARTPTAAPVAAPARAAALAAASAAWPSVTGHWLRGDTDSRFTAWFADGELRYLEEVALRRGAPPLRGRYYFEHGALFYYSGEAPAGATVGGGATGIAASVPVLAEFDGAQARRAVRVEHYGEVLLEAAAVTELRRHAAILAGVARDEWSATGRR